MTFDIRNHLDALTPAKSKGFYVCPICNGSRLGIQSATGKYKCWSNECDSALIRNFVAPLDPEQTAAAPKQKLPPKPKAKPVVVSTMPTWQTLPGDRTYPPKIETIEGHEIYYKYPPIEDDRERYVKRIEYKDSEKGKFIRPYVRLFGVSAMGKGDVQWDAYRLSEALEHCGGGEWIFAVEGEKTVEACRYLGLPCITWQGGSWTEDDLSRAIVQLKAGSCGGLIFIPDNDEPGQKKAAKVSAAAAAHSFPCLVLKPFWVWDLMPEKGDIADYVQNCLAMKDSVEDMMIGIKRAISMAYENQKPDPAREPQPEPVETDSPIIAETTSPLSDPKPETKRIHGGYKDLKVAELFDFVGNELSGRLTFDDLRSEILLEGEPLTFGHDLKFWFFDKFGESAPKEDIYSCLLYHAKQHSFNPVEKYLNEVITSAKRVDITNLSSRYFGTEDPIYDRMVEMWLISAVARVMDPGCQVDHTLILQSGQGKYKSTWFKTLGGDWFSDSVKDIENKDSLLTMHSSWIIELSELDRITSKKQAGIIKHFLTQREDTFRKPYAKEVERNPRRALFCGTVNPSRFLVDSENRRFWIIPVADHIEAINIPLLETERDGIWAAAVDALLSGRPWYPTDEEKAQISLINKEFQDVDVWTEPIEEYCSNLPWVSVYEILSELFKLGKSEMDRRSEMRVARILDNLGWTKQTRKEIYGKWRRVRLNPSWNEPEARHIADNTNTNLSNYIDGKVGNVGQSIDTQSSQDYQPTYQPPVEVGINGGRYIPTPSGEVGHTETQSQSGNYQPTELPTPIPEKYSRAGFKYAIGQQVYMKNSSVILTIKEFPCAGGNFSARRYWCEFPNGAEDWIAQSDLVLLA